MVQLRPPDEMISGEAHPHSSQVLRGAEGAGWGSLGDGAEAAGTWPGAGGCRGLPASPDAVLGEPGAGVSSSLWPPPLESRLLLPATHLVVVCYSGPQGREAPRDKVTSLPYRLST